MPNAPPEMIVIPSSASVAAISLVVIAGRRRSRRAPRRWPPSAGSSSASRRCRAATGAAAGRRRDRRAARATPDRRDRPSAARPRATLRAWRQAAAGSGGGATCGGPLDKASSAGAAAEDEVAVGAGARRDREELRRGHLPQRRAEHADRRGRPGSSASRGPGAPRGRARSHAQPPSTGPARSRPPAGRGRPTPSRSATVHDSATIRSALRALIWPRSMARSSGSRAPGSGRKCRRNSLPGISAFSRQGVSGSRRGGPVRWRPGPARRRPRSARRSWRSQQELDAADRHQVDLDVDPVQQRSGQARQVAAPRPAGVQVHPDPAAWVRAHGHGLAARISVNRAGNRAVTPDLAIMTCPDLQRLAQRVQYVAVELRRLVQEQAAPVGQRRGAGPDDAAAAAHDRGDRRGVVRRAERRLGHQRAARRQRAGDRMDGGDLQRLGRPERRHDRRQSLGQQGFAHARRAKQHQVVAARRADLRRPPRHRLSRDVGEVDREAGRCTPSRALAAGSSLAAIGGHGGQAGTRPEHPDCAGRAWPGLRAPVAQPGDQRRQVRRPYDLQAGYQGRLGQVVAAG